MTTFDRIREKLITGNISTASKVICMVVAIMLCPLALAIPYWWDHSPLAAEFCKVLDGIFKFILMG